jgi:hypothetical protein
VVLLYAQRVESNSKSIAGKIPVEARRHLTLTSEVQSQGCRFDHLVGWYGQNPTRTTRTRSSDWSVLIVEPLATGDVAMLAGLD